jgi:hypothetical protein
LAEDEEKMRYLLKIWLLIFAMILFSLVFSVLRENANGPAFKQAISPTSGPSH